MTTQNKFKSACGAGKNGVVTSMLLVLKIKSILKPFAC